MSEELKNSRWDDIPFSPKKFPFFYGWIIVAIATLTVISSMPGQTTGIGVFTDYILDSMEMPRTDSSLAYLFGTIGGTIVLPLVGRILDKHGPRILIVAASLGLGGSMVYLSQVDHIARIGGMDNLFFSWFVLTFGYALIRSFGQGTMDVIAQVTVGKWFHYRRGLATGIMCVFVAIGFNTFPLLFNRMTESSLGWRNTYLVLTGVIGGGLAILGWIFYREKPEDCGLVMDGHIREEDKARLSKKQPPVKKEFTRNEAIKTRVFWIFCLGMCTQGFVYTSFGYHFTDLTAWHELGRDYSVFIPISAFSITTAFLGSWISDRIRMKYLLIFMMFTQVCGSFALLHFGPKWSWSWWLMAFGYGCSIGLLIPIATVVWPRFFGREQLGRIGSFNFSLMCVASAFGPFTYSMGKKYTDSYASIITACLVPPIIVLFMALKARNPQELISDQSVNSNVVES